MSVSLGREILSKEVYGSHASQVQQAAACARDIRIQVPCDLSPENVQMHFAQHVAFQVFNQYMTYWNPFESCTYQSIFTRSALETKNKKLFCFIKDLSWLSDEDKSNVKDYLKNKKEIDNLDKVFDKIGKGTFLTTDQKTQKQQPKSIAIQPPAYFDTRDIYGDD
jgi:hypothetical protein